MTLSYAFGGNTGQSYDALQRRRAYLEAIQKQSMGDQPKTGAEGILSGLNSVFSDLMLRKLGKQEDANRQKATQAALDIFGRPAPDVIPPNPGVSTPRNPNDPVQIGNDTMAALGKTPNGWDGIKAGIFAGESGGDYNALFGFQNRPGGAFSNVQLTGMSVDDALKFADPNGQYGQHVKGQIGRVATPMGAYQVVGTTLAAAKKGLGLRGDEIMTPALQDRIGQWIYQNQGTGAWEGYKGPQQPQGGMDPQILMAMSDPNLPPEMKSALGVLLQQRIAAAQPPDPMKALELQKTQLELQQMQNPQAQSVEYGLQPIVTQDADGKYHLFQLPKDGGSPKEVQLPYGWTPKQQYLDTGTGFQAVPTQGVAGDSPVVVPKDVSGKAAATAVGEAAGAAQVALPGAAQAAQDVATQVESLKNDPYLPRMLGPVDSMLPNVSTDAARVQGKMDQLQGGAFLQARQLLKGGGAITDYEGQKAEAAFARMSKAQSVEDYKAALDEFNYYVQQGIKKLEAQAAMTDKSAPAEEGKTYTFNPETGELE